MHTSTTRSRDGVEPGHLQVDEGERRLGDGQVPRRSGGGRGHERPITLTKRARARPPSSPRRRGRPGSRTSAAGRRGTTTTSPGARVHARPTRRARSSRLAREVLARPRRVRDADQARPRGELHAVDLHAGDGVGQKLADRDRRRAAAPGGARREVLHRRARRAMSSSMVTWSAAAARWRTRASGSRVPLSRFAQVARGTPASFAICCWVRPRASRSCVMFGAEPRRDVGVHAQQVGALPTHWQAAPMTRERRAHAGA